MPISPNALNTASLPALYCAEALRRIERHYAPRSSPRLMERAGATGAAKAMEIMGGRHGRVLVMCGPGNHGGDGFVIARYLQVLGHGVRLLLACPLADYRGDAAVNAEVVRRAGLTILDLSTASPEDWAAALRDAAWIVDALLGTGATGAPRGAVATAITAINDARAAGEGRGVRVFSVDLPSGLDC